MGLTCVGLLSTGGPAEVIAISERAEGLEKARGLGATAAVRPSHLHPTDRLSAPDPERLGDGFDVVVEASGRQDSLDLSSELVSPHGTLLILGYHQGGRRNIDVGLWNWKAIQVINGHVRRRPELIQAIRRGVELIGRGRLSMQALITDEMPLDQVDRAFSLLSEKPPGVTKVVIDPTRLGETR
jgi:threonine dehydrogenase-like Zn-dependent dehydrogenase